MKKTLLSCAVVLASVSILASCGGSSEFDTSKNVTAYTRDTTSGTRDGFCTKIGIEDAKSDDSLLKGGIGQAASNGDMMTKVAGDLYGIGYASFSEISTNKDIKGIKVDGVVATEESIKDGNYNLQRNFNYVYNDKSSDDVMNALVQSYIAYMNSTDGQAIVESEGGIIEDASKATKSWDELCADTSNSWAVTLGLNGDTINSAVSGKTITFVGSTSVEAMSEALSDSWVALFGDVKPSVVHNHTGSGDAIKNLQNATGQIGFASRDFKDSEKETATTNGWTYGKICLDAISVIVNVDNPIENITTQQIRDIYVNPEAIKDKETSEENFGADYSSETPITTWSQILG